MATKMSINISGAACEFMTEEKTNRGINCTTSVHRGLALLRWWYQVRKDGGKVLVENKDGQIELITFPW